MAVAMPRAPRQARFHRASAGRTGSVSIQRDVIIGVAAYLEMPTTLQVAPGYGGTGLEHTAADFIRDLERHGPGVRMADVFALAKTYQAMEPDELRKLLHHPGHEVRVGAVSIMDFQARAKKTSAERRRALYDLYMNNHEHIDSWSMVDRAAPYVVGGYLWDKPREPLYALARSPRPMERRTAVVATYYFIRQHDLEDTFRIAAILAHDPDELVQKAVGGWVREAGKQDLGRLRLYLDEFAATMPRSALRYAVEHLDADERSRYLGMRRGAA
jgi:hypothetical protein